MDTSSTACMYLRLEYVKAAGSDSCLLSMCSVTCVVKFMVRRLRLLGNSRNVIQGMHYWQRVLRV